MFELSRASGAGMFLWGRVPDATPVDELVRRARIEFLRGTLRAA
jgi:hypothetical protein